MTCDHFFVHPVHDPAPTCLYCGQEATQYGTASHSLARPMPFVPERRVRDGVSYPLQKRVPSSQAGAPDYVVTVVDPDSLFSTCTCPGFAYRSSCRHIALVTAEVRQRPPVVDESPVVDS